MRIRGAVTMPTCGNCGKTVAFSDVTCPHCDVLLAAYSSPAGADGSEITIEPVPLPVTEIPTPDMEVKPPSEKDVVTDPDQVAVEAISTAPQPLFDTRITIEEVARAAEGDHEQPVVTVAGDKVRTKKVEFETPEWAKPPVDADPIPTIEEDDASIPLITRTTSSSRQSGSASEAKQTGDDEDDDPEPEPEPAGESWLYSQPDAPSSAAPTTPPEPDPTPITMVEPDGAASGYSGSRRRAVAKTPNPGATPQPGEGRRPTPAERATNRRRTPLTAQDQQTAATNLSSNIGCATIYGLILAVLWLSTIVALINGNFNPGLLFLTFAATWGYGPARKFINEMRPT